MKQCIVILMFISVYAHGMEQETQKKKVQFEEDKIVINYDQSPKQEWYTAEQEFKMSLEQDQEELLRKKRRLNKRNMQRDFPSYDLESLFQKEQPQQHPCSQCMRLLAGCLMLWGIGTALYAMMSDSQS